MKKIVITWIGLLFLLIDTRIASFIRYPAYIPFDTPAPDTVNMIIRHLLGDSAKIDIFSDVIGLALILYITCKIVNENRKAFCAFVLAGISLLLYAVNWLAPFFLNGEARYVAGFFLYIIYIFFECLTTIQTGLVCCVMTESIENHAWNNVVEIFIILAAASGFIRGMSYFYELPKTTVIYYGVQIFFTVLYTVMYWKHRDFIKAE